MALVKASLQLVCGCALTSEMHHVDIVATAASAALPSLHF